MSYVLTKKETAEFLKVSTRTLDRWEKTKYGPGRIKVGSKILYLLEGIQRWLDSKILIKDPSCSYIVDDKELNIQSDLTDREKSREIESKLKGLIEQYNLSVSHIIVNESYFTITWYSGDDYLKWSEERDESFYDFYQSLADMHEADFYHFSAEYPFSNSIEKIPFSWVMEGRI